MQALQRIIPFSLGIGLGAGTTLIYGRNEEDKQTELVTKDQDIKTSLYKYGKPETSVSIHEYESHSLAYDRSKRIPVWVMEVLSNTDKEKVANRRQSTFQPDPTVPKEFTAMNSDYRRSGWSRGHMAAAGNYKHCQKSMNDTFYLTNVVPQNMDNNESYWYRIEDYCRKLGKRYNEVRVISGPLFLQSTDENGKKTVQYQVIGDNDVSVPTHLYKIIVAENKGEPPLLGSFIVPNESVIDEPLTTFTTPLEAIEKLTGTKFLQFLQKHKSLDLCNTDGCQLMSMKEYSIIHYSRRIPNARTKEYLESLWTEINNKGVESNELLKQAYKKRLRELEEEK